MELENNNALKETALIALLAAILFVQQILLSFIPNVSFTVLLLFLYSKILGFRKTAIIILIHVTAINLLSPFGPLLPVHIPSMIFGWLIIPIFLTTIFKKVEDPFTLAFLGLIHGFIYGWVYIPVSVFLLDIPFKEYFLMDLIFEVIMAVSSFVTILWLYKPLYKFLEKQLDK
jgi:hypothetical protein